jgi:hypothetical protein
MFYLDQVSDNAILPQSCRKDTIKPYIFAVSGIMLDASYKI